MNFLKPVLVTVLLAAGSVTQVQAVELKESATHDERERQLIIQQTAMINSAESLQAYLNDMPSDSPFMALSRSSRERLAASLKFNEKGVTTFRTDDIEDELSVTDAHKLLSLFGAARVISFLPGLRVESDLDRRVRMGYPFRSRPGSLNVTDYPGYECVSRATCAAGLNTICMSGC